jgi:hypothetical protein
MARRGKGGGRRVRERLPPQEPDLVNPSLFNKLEGDRHSAAWRIDDAPDAGCVRLSFLSPVVMAGPVPAIHAAPTGPALESQRQRCRVDARDKPVHDVSLLNGVKP